MGRAFWGRLRGKVLWADGLASSDVSLKPRTVHSIVCAWCVFDCGPIGIISNQQGSRTGVRPGHRRLHTRLNTPVVAFLLLVAMPFVTSSFLILVVRPGAPSSVLAPIIQFVFFVV